MQMIAVFLTPEAFREVLQNVVGDENEQNIGDAIKEMYGREIEHIADYTRVGNPYEGYELEKNDGVIVCVIDGSDSRYLGRAIAASLGFTRDYVQEDSWHGVFFI